jgi:hypothetical protein
VLHQSDLHWPQILTADNIADSESLVKRTASKGIAKVATGRDKYGPQRWTLFMKFFSQSMKVNPRISYVFIKLEARCNPKYSSIAASA